jgi:hypothetical protein
MGMLFSRPAKSRYTTSGSLTPLVFYNSFSYDQPVLINFELNYGYRKVQDFLVDTQKLWQDTSVKVNNSYQSSLFDKYWPVPKGTTGIYINGQASVKMYLYEMTFSNAYINTSDFIKDNKSYYGSNNNIQWTVTYKIEPASDLNQVAVEISASGTMSKIDSIQIINEEAKTSWGFYSSYVPYYVKASVTDANFEHNFMVTINYVGNFNTNIVIDGQSVSQAASTTNTSPSNEQYTLNLIAVT